MLIILKKYANNDGVPGESPESRQRRTFMRHWGINYIFKRKSRAPRNARSS